MKYILKAIIRNLNSLKSLIKILSFRNISLVSEHYLYSYILQKKIPEVAYIAVTFKCQFDCKYCGVALYPLNRQELAIREFIDIIGQLAALKIPRIHFTGGEPLLKNELENLIFYAYKKGMVTVLESNGWDLSCKRIVSLKKQHLSCICLSLDGVSEETHDRRCGRKGGFLRAIEAINNCRKERIPCVISIAVTRELISSGEIFKILKLSEKLKVSGIRLISVRPMGKLLKKEKEILTSQEKAKIKKITNLTTVPLLGKGPDEKICGAAGKSVFVSPYGEVQPCGYIPYSFGNIRYENIRFILNRLLNHEMFNFFKQGSGCVIQDYNFRNKYINSIKLNSDLPIRLY